MIRYFTYTCQNHDNNILNWLILENIHISSKNGFSLIWTGEGGGGVCYDHWGTDCNYCLGRSTGFFNLFRDLKTREVVQNSCFLLVRPGNLNLRKFIYCTVCQKAD